MQDWIKDFWKELGIGLMIAIPMAFLIMTVILIAAKEIHGVELLWLKWL